MLLFLFPYKFTGSFYQRHQISYLNKNLNSRIEVHDLSNVINKEWNKAFVNRRHKFARVFNSAIEWNNYMKKLKKKEKEIYVVNLLDFNSFNSFLIHLYIKKLNLKVLQYCSPEVCIRKNIKNNSYLNYIKVFFNLFFYNPSRFFFLIKTTILNKLIHLIKFNQLYVFYTGKKKFLKKNLSFKKKKLIKFNSHDYSNYLLHKKNTLKKKKYIIFLDAPTPYFVGDKQLFKIKINYNIKKWYEDLNNFLTQIEIEFNSKVIIIPHPRVIELKNPYYDKKFEVRRDLDSTSKLIPNSQFVIAISCTMAVSYCVLNYKKILFVYNDQIKHQNPKMMSNLIHMAKILKANLFNLNSKIKKNILLNSINKSVYDKYKFDYLVSKNLINNTNIDIFNNFLKKNK